MRRDRVAPTPARPPNRGLGPGGGRWAAGRHHTEREQSERAVRVAPRQGFCREGYLCPRLVTLDRAPAQLSPRPGGRGSGQRWSFPPCPLPLPPRLSAPCACGNGVLCPRKQPTHPRPTPPFFPPQKCSQVVCNSYLKIDYCTLYVTRRKKDRFLFFIRKRLFLDFLPGKT